MLKILVCMIVSSNAAASLGPDAHQRAGADWINLTGAETAPNIAEITIFDDRVEVGLFCCRYPQTAG